MPVRTTVTIKMPEWLVDVMKNPDGAIDRAMQSVAGILQQVENEGNVEAVRILHQAGVKPRNSGGGTVPGIYDAFGGYGAGLKHNPIIGGQFSKNFSNISKKSGKYNMVFGVGDLDVLDTLTTTDGKGYYWEVLDQGNPSYDILPRNGMALRFPVNSQVLAGYSRGGVTYMDKFRALWKRHPGYGTGYGLFSHVLHPAKKGIHFIDKTFNYLNNLVNKMSPSIVSGILNDGFRIGRRGQVQVRGIFAGKGFGFNRFVNIGNYDI